MRCGVRCTFVMIWLRRRFERRHLGGRRVSCDNCSRWDVATGEWATLKAHSNGVASAVFCDDVLVVGQALLSPDGRRVSGSVDNIKLGG